MKGGEKKMGVFTTIAMGDSIVLPEGNYNAKISSVYEKNQSTAVIEICIITPGLQYDGKQIPIQYPSYSEKRRNQFISDCALLGINDVKLLDDQNVRGSLMGRCLVVNIAHSTKNGRFYYDVKFVKAEQIESNQNAQNQFNW
jgi:hypothetical protein